MSNLGTRKVIPCPESAGSREGGEEIQREDRTALYVQITGGTRVDTKAEIRQKGAQSHLTKNINQILCIQSRSLNLRTWAGEKQVCTEKKKVYTPQRKSN